MSSLITGEGLKDSSIESSDSCMAEVHKIHQENVKKLSAMSKEDIMEEQTRLKQMIGTYSSYEKVLVK